MPHLLEQLLGHKPETETGAKLDFRAVSGLLGLSLMNGLYLNTLPLINGAWERLGFTPDRVGDLLTIQLLIGALASIVLSSRLHSLSARNLGLAAGLLLFSTNIWLAFSTAFVAILLGVFATGIALGTLIACGAAAIAATDRVDRYTAVTLFGVSLLVAGLTVAVAHAADTSGILGLFLAQAAVALLATGLTGFVTRQRSGAAMTASTPLLKAMQSPFVLSAVFLEIATAGIWVFAERIGATIGLHTETVGEMIAASSIFAILGAAVAGMLARRRRQLALAVLACLCFGLANAAIAVAYSPPLFFLAVSLQAFFFVFSGPFVTAVGVAIDPSGGLVAGAHGWSTLAGALAPAIAGLVVRTGHFDQLALLGAAATLISVVALVLAARDISSRRLAVTEDQTQP